MGEKLGTWLRIQIKIPKDHMRSLFVKDWIVSFFFFFYLFFLLFLTRESRLESDTLVCVCVRERVCTVSDSVSLLCIISSPNFVNHKLLFLYNRKRNLIILSFIILRAHMHYVDIDYYNNICVDRHAYIINFIWEIKINY